MATGKVTRAQTPPSSGTKTRIASLATDQAVAPALGLLHRERTPDAAPEGKEQGRAEGPAKARRNRPLLPMPRGKVSGGAGRNSTGGMTQVRHTVDLYVPPRDLEVMMAVAERLEQRLSQPTSLARVDVREQRLLALAQAYLWLERKRMELAQGKPPGTVTVREVAESLALSPEEVQAFYKMGLRARSYILMSMHSIISALANKYAGAFSIGREELIQEGFRGAMKAVENYDQAKATAMGATFRNFAQFYVMSAMLQAAKSEVRMGAPFLPRDREPRAQTQLLLPPNANSNANAEGARPGELPSRAESLGQEEEEDREEGEKDAPRRRRKGLRIRNFYGYLPQDEWLDDKGSTLVGADPELMKPAYQLLDESKRAKDVAVLLEKAAKEIPAVDMEVLARVYGLQGQQPMKRTQVARELGMEPGAVQKSEKRALKKLREMLQL